MKHKIRKKNIVTAVLTTVVILISFGISVYLLLQADFSTKQNGVRLRVEEQRTQIQEDHYETGQYPYLVFDLDGVVLYADPEFQLKEGTTVNPQEMLQVDESFYHNYADMEKQVFVLNKGQRVNGFAVFLIPRIDLQTASRQQILFRCLLPMAVGIVIVLLIMCLWVYDYNRNILKPMDEICVSAKGIICGNYDYEIVRAYGQKPRDNEISELTYSFELMRDELKEKQLREENLKKAQQELISCISHDLKTPISTIKAYGEGLRDGIARDEEEQKQYTEIIIKKTDLLITMINELLEFSNTQLRQLSIVRTEQYFRSYFEELMKELQVYCAQRRMTLEYQMKFSDAIVSIDEKRMTEVFYNLVENSIKYRRDEKEGHIQILAERDTALENGHDYTVIRVIDDGIGIMADDIPYVFDTFYRAEKSRSTSIPGSGLGLSICKYIVEAHDGEIYCKSGEKAGCEFGIRF